MTGAGRSVVFRRTTVLTMDDNRTVLADADLLVLGGRIADVGFGLAVPHGTVEVDGTGGVLVPGFIDTHRHMWQTVVRGYGADWTLRQYFSWFRQHRKAFRPEEVFAGNLLSAHEALEAGVTTTVDWSHGLQSVDHAEAALDALEQAEGRYVLAYGNMFDPPASWASTPEFRSFVTRRLGSRDRIGLQLAVDVRGDPTFPEGPAFAAAREFDAGITGHTGVWGVLGDASIDVMHDNEVMDDRSVYVHAASLSMQSYRRIADSGGTISIAAESEQHAGQGYPPTRVARAHNIPVSLSSDTSIWWSADFFSAMRATIGADRADEHAVAHRSGRIVERNPLKCADVLEWATRGGARAIGRDHDLGRLVRGYRADVVLVKNDASPVSVPLLDPYGYLVLQAQRGDVHTVLVDGQFVKTDGRLVGDGLARAKKHLDHSLEHLQPILERTTGENQT